MKKTAFYFLSLTATAGLMACSNNHSSGSSASGATAQSATSSSQEDANTTMLVQYVQSSVQSDTQNSGSSSSIGPQTGSSMSFALEGALLIGLPSCVSVANNSSGSDKDYLTTYTCTNITGTIEVKSSQSSGDDSFEIIALVDLTNPISGNTSDINSSYTVTNDAGVLTFARQLDDTFVIATNASSSSSSSSSSSTSNSYEVKGNSNEVITPTDTSKPANGGGIQINDTLDVYMNGTEGGTYSVTSTGLEYSSCGLSSGSITFVKGSDTYVLTIASCTSSSLTKNGTAVGNP